MAEIKLTVHSNFSKTTAAIKSFGDVIEKEAQRIERFRERFKGGEINSFIEKNQQAAAAVLAIRGPLEAATSKQAELRRETELLIRGGINPQNEASQKLQREYGKTTKQVGIHSNAQRINEQAVRGATIALGAMARATAVLGANGIKAYSEYSKSLANVNTLIPMSTAEMGALDDRLNELSVSFATHKSELAGDVYQALSAGAADLDEALSIVETSSQQSKDALIGVGASVFTLEQVRVVLQNLSIELGEKLLPPLAKTAEKLLAFVSDTDRMKRTMEITLPILGAIAGALGTMLIISKLIGIVEGFSAAMGILNIVMAANPVIAIGAAVALLITGLVLLYKNWDKVVVFFQESGAKLKLRLGQIGSAIATGWIVAIQKLKIVFINIIVFIADRYLGMAQKLLGGLDKFAKIAEIKVFGRLNDGVAKWREGLDAAKTAAVEKSNAIIEAARAERAAMQDTTNAELQAIKDIAAVQKATMNEMEEDAGFATGGGDGGDDGDDGDDDEQKKRLADYARFLKNRIELDKKNFDEQKQFLEEKKAGIAAIEGITDEQRAAAMQAIDNEEKRRIDNIASYHINVLRKQLDTENRDLIDRKDFLKDQAAEIRDLESLTKEEKEAALQAISNEEKKLMDDVTSHYVATYQTRMEDANMDFEGRKQFLEAQQEELRALQTLDADEKLARQQAITDEEKRLLDDVTNHRINTLQTQMDNDEMNAEEQLILLQEQAQLILENDQLTAEQKAVILAWIANESLRLENKVAEDAKLKRDLTLKHTASLFGAIGSLIDATGNKSREAAIAGKALASAQALINSFLAFTGVIAMEKGGLVVKLIAGATVLAAGIAAQVKILSTPIPSAEIGGQFAVPDSRYSSRGDSQLLRVNPGEQVDVAPRGEEDQDNLTVVVQVDRQSIYGVVKVGAKSGQLTITPDNNFDALSIEAEDF